MEVPEPSTVSFIGTIFESRGMEKNGTALPADRLGNAAKLANKSERAGLRS
jgi:hypothetical protein